MCDVKLDKKLKLFFELKEKKKKSGTISLN
jgi:hypothetical protein